MEIGLELDNANLLAFGIFGWGLFLMMIPVCFAIDRKWKHYVRFQNREWFDHCQKIVDKISDDKF